ncbi:MAG: hypothetical protein ACRC2S_12170 [Waterburya sp.]
MKIKNMLKRHSNKIGKYLLVVILNLSFFSLCLPKQVLANSNNKIQNLLQEKYSLLQETSRLNQLYFQAGTKDSKDYIEDSIWLTSEMLEIELQLASSPQERIQALNKALEQALSLEKDAKLWRKAGLEWLGWKEDIVIMEIWRTDIQIRLERQKEGLE